MVRKPGEFALEYAGFWIRLAALVIDSAFLFLLFYFLYSTVSDCFNRTFISKLTFGLIFFLLTLAYFVTLWALRGQTIGKMILGLKILKTDYTPLEWNNAVKRFFCSLLCILTLFIGFIVIAFDEKKQGLHDKLADTYVVKIPVRQVILSDNYAKGRIG